MTLYKISEIAEQDISEIVSYIAEENLPAASELLDSLYEAMDNLAEHPQLGHWRKDLTHHDVRFWPFKWHYLIIYRDTNPIEIIRVLSGYRDLSVILS
jgi:plasmid stabilization system protein ParE